VRNEIFPNNGLSGSELWSVFFFFREVNDALRIVSLIYRLNVRVFVSLWSEGLRVYFLTLESPGHVMYVAPRSISWRQPSLHSCYFGYCLLSKNV